MVFDDNRLMYSFFCKITYPLYFSILENNNNHEIKKKTTTMLDIYDDGDIDEPVVSDLLVAASFRNKHPPVQVIHSFLKIFYIKRLP
jgi:hypothetical protein